MEKVNKSCMDYCNTCTDSVVIKKQELKNLYKRLKECEEIIEIYRREKQQYMKLLRQ